MRHIDVYPLPSLTSRLRLEGATAVVIDVLRATTTLITAYASGAKTILPLNDIEEAQRRKAELEARNPGSTLTGGERQGVLIAGFDLGNSPQSYVPDRVAGKTLVFTTTNGTVAMEAAKPARRILLAGLVNAKAVVEQLRNEERIAIICAGTDNVPTEEDLLLAGCLVSRLVRNETGSDRLNEEARTVKTVWEKGFISCQNDEIESELTKYLRQSRGGRNLVDLKLDADISAAARIDSIDIVPELDPVSMRIQRQ